jgi:hypothetical protein
MLKFNLRVDKYIYTHKHIYLCVCVCVCVYNTVLILSILRSYFHKTNYKLKLKKHRVAQELREPDCMDMYLSFAIYQLYTTNQLLILSQPQFFCKMETLQVHKLN